MVALSTRSSARRWLFPILVVLLVLGHACELPAYPSIVGSSHTAEEPHHPGDGHHGSEQALSCDPVTATSTPGHAQVVVVPGSSVVSGVEDPAPVRVTVQVFEAAKLADRPPLFLLHASFRI